MAYARTAQNNKIPSLGCVPIYFYFVLWSGLARRSVQTYEKWSFFKYFYQFWSFSPSFWASYGVAYIKIAWNDNSTTCSCVPNYFYFLWKSTLPGGVLKLMKNDHFLVLLAVWVLSPKFLARLRSGTAQNNESFTSSYVLNCFYFALWAKLVGRVFKVMKNDEFLVLLTIGSISPSFWAD